MTRSTLYRITVVLILLLFSVNPGGMTVAAPDAPTQVKSLGGPPRPAVLRLDPSTSTFRIPPPAIYTQRSPLKVHSATINVTYLPNGATDGFGYSCLTWPADAITAFEYAASIWETLITSTVPIEIHACWTNFGDPNILGVGGADDYYSNFAGAPLVNTLYPTALANALAGTRMHGSTVDIHVAYGSTFAWYFGTDGSTPLNKVDFASVVLHEICHGLGFAGSMTVKSGLGYWGWDYYPISVAYDHFTENGVGTDLLSYTNGSAALAAQLVSDNLYFDGPNANAANGGQRPKLFAPATWMQGSSYSHLDEIFNGTADDLMTYAIPNGQSMHAPGPIAMGILADVGWPFENTPPSLSDLPNQTLAPGQSKNNAIDLWTYASDTQDQDDALTFSIINSPPLTVGVTIDSERYIDITPTESFTGTFPVVVEVQDTEGLTDTNSFTITFTEIETHYIYLPLVLRCYPLVPSLLPISNPDGDGLYTVQWTMPSCCSTPPSQYEFQVATDPAFSYVDGDTTSATSVNVYTPDPATYYWRVRAYINGQWTGWSNVRSVTVRSFSYVYVQNDTGGTLTIEIVGIEKRSFSAGFYDYWRSVPSGYHTVNVWANCGSLLGKSINFLEGDFLLHYYCGYQSLVTLPDTAARVMSGVDFIFESTVP